MDDKKKLSKNGRNFSSNRCQFGSVYSRAINYFFNDYVRNTNYLLYITYKIRIIISSIFRFNEYYSLFWTNYRYYTCACYCINDVMEDSHICTYYVCHRSNIRKQFFITIYNGKKCTNSPDYYYLDRKSTRLNS